MKSTVRSIRRHSSNVGPSTTTTTTPTERNSSNDETITPSTGEPKPVKCTDHTPLLGPPNRLEKITQSGSELDDNNLTKGVSPQQQNLLRRQQRRKVQFDALHQEMELVSYSISETGQSRRIMPRHLSIERTKKRRLLERQEQTRETNNDHDEGSYVVEPSNAPRKIRGPKAAAEDHVVEASLVFGAKPSLKLDAIEDAEADEPDDDEVDDDDYDRDAVAPIDEEEDDDDDEEEGNSDNDSNEDEDDVALEPNIEVEEDKGEVDQTELFDVQSSKSLQGKKRNTSAMKFPNAKRKKTTRLQRLKNFKSMRMAEKHGAALGAHVQGKSDVAIQKLKQIAASAPLAPQIYSSLGMVYEDLLQESQKKGATLTVNETNEDSNIQEKTMGDASNQTHINQDTYLDLKNDDPDALQAMIHDKSVRDQLSLAKKAYGSYHVAAILYKRDYSLWLRAADSAYEISNIHTSIMKLPEITENVIEFHRAEK